jgi:putative phosphoribosyl transferase
MQVFSDRYQGGRVLASKLLAYADRPDLIVLGLPRGGVPVAYEVARALHAPLDVYIVRKLGLPGHEELAMGAVASGGVIVINEEVVDALRIPGHVIDAVARKGAAEIARREHIYRNGRPPPDVAGRVAMLVDDGVATGSTMYAAGTALRNQRAARVIVATPVVAAPTVPALREVADEVVYIEAPENFIAVGQYYADFAPTTDDEVRELIAGRAEPSKRQREVSTRTVAVPAGGVTLSGDLTVPSQAQGIVLFAHGAGSSRHSPRNQFVASVLQEAGFATLLMDLLTEQEEVSERFTAHLRFDIDLLARRLIAVTDWMSGEPSTKGLAVGYFGASTGAAAALVAAAERTLEVAAIVSRGGRPDLAASALSRVRAPALFIVGGNDPLVLDLNGQALRQLGTEKRLEIVPGASHLFEEPGTLERVAELATEWFEDHLPTAPVTETRAAETAAGDARSSEAGESR